MTDTKPKFDPLADFLLVADAYIAAAQFRGAGVNKDSATSSRVFDDGKKLSALRSGHDDIGTKRLTAALQWFSDNWPPDGEWPAAVVRPEVSPAEVAAAE